MSRPHVLFRAILLAAAGVLAALLCPAMSFLPATRAQSPGGTPLNVLLDMRDAVEKRLTPTSPQVTVARSQNASAPGVLVAIRPGADAYPGINIHPVGKIWDLSAYGHVEARVVNTGAMPLTVALRVDNAGDWRDNPWDTESISLAPGASGTITVLFGYSYGHKPGYALKPGAVVNIMLFTTKSDTMQSFRIESLTAGGPAGEHPPVAPADVRVKPRNGLLFGAGVPVDPVTQITSEGAQVSLSGPRPHQALRFLFPASPAAQSASFKPAVGRWDLRDCLEVRVRVRNGGTTPVTPRVRLETNGGTSPWTPAPAPLAPGAGGEITVSFAGETVANPSQPGSGSQITSDAVSAVTVGVEKADRESVLRVEAIRADLGPAPSLPAWLGKRPPVPGAWVKSLDDEFNGTVLNSSLWSIYGDNFWDQQTHWSKDDVTVGGGYVRLRYEKKRGFNNDNPAQKQTGYAAGYLHTYDKWAQRYGYFEARMKLPKAPGLWPAFWMMPDRGDRTDPQWKRQDTANGGMEFDIMEHLTRWGPVRYNIAMHYDGYGKDHKSVGSDKIYVHPDKDGFLTCGLLWTPGSATYYCNGREVLRWRSPRIASVPAILMFTLPQGGWDNSPVEDARLPDDFVIDYVRVWQRRDLASRADGKKPQGQG